MATGNFTAVEAEGLKDIECVICLEPWDKPVELEPCRHVFCERCAAPLRHCPECRANIAGRKQPNRILVNLAESAVMKCETCQWTGTREQSRTHRCGDQPQGQPAAAGQPSRPQTWQPPAHSTQNPAALPQPNIPPPQPSCAPSSSQPQRQLQQQQQQQQPHPGAAVGGPPGPWTEYGLTQDEYDHIMTVFLTFDADDSGELDRREVTTLCRWLNYAHGERDIDAMFRAMDTDRSGALSMDEFCRWISTHRPDPQALYGLSHEEYENTLFAFHSYDRDQNGILNRQEFGQLAMRQGWARSAPEADQLFNSIDTDRNNGVDLDEILRYRHRAKTGSAFSGPAPAGSTPGYGAQPSTPAPMWQAQGGAWQQQQRQQPPQHGQWQQAGPGWQAQGGPGWSQSQSQSQGWQQPPQQQQQQHYGQYPSQQAPRPRTLEGRVVEVSLGNAFRGVPVFVTVAPGAQAPQLFRTEPASGNDGRAAFNADFVVPVHNPQDNAVVRVFRASDGEELCGTMVRLSDVPPGNTAPRDEWFPLHARDANRFNAAGCRVHLRLSMIG